MPRLFSVPVQAKDVRTMMTLIETSRDDLIGLCKKYHVVRLEVFGSAASGSFNPLTSDVDFLVEFGPCGDMDGLGQYFGFQDALRQLFGREVDLVETGAMRNPYFIQTVNETRRLVYAAEEPQTA